ncbi:hypothetical protein, conserved [Leishmania lindenbergi]|uniref:Uncharacterized protein n=1 Tax=Leishmania lindenbergi TaxID=651832 RepID=A0AAW3APM2_9TRYP
MGCKASTVRNSESSHDSRTASPGVSSSPNTNASTRYMPKNLTSTSPYRSNRKEDNGEANGSYTRDGGLSHTQYVDAQDDDTFATLSQEMVNQSDSDLTRCVFPTGKRRGDMPGLPCHSSDPAFPRVAEDVVRGNDHTAVAHQRKGTAESHFDPLPIPDVAQLQECAGTRVANSSLPSRTITVDSRDCSATFRAGIDVHDKTDSVQAAKEYQQHVQARRSTEAAHTKRRQLEEFDPVRPVDSFNVTHRGLLGRCWDRRAPELVLISFAYAMEAALQAAEETHLGRTTTSPPPGAETERDEHPFASPRVPLTPLSHTTGHLPGVAGSRGPSQAMPGSPRGCSLGGRRVPRRSHWFSVSCDTTYPPAKGSDLGNEAGMTMSSFYMSSGVASPIMTWPCPSGSRLPLSASLPALNWAGIAPLRSKSKPFMATEASSPVIYGGTTEGLSDEEDGGTAQPRQPLTPEQISALSMEKRGQYYNDFLARDPRFMGIKDCFAFRLADGVGEDPSTKFLRKRNLEPAPGVVARQWNRVEFVHPTLHTLIRAVAMTHGMTLNASQLEMLQRQAGGAMAEMPSRASFSQYLLSHTENRSFSRGGGSLNTSFLSQPDKPQSTSDTPGSYTNNSLLSPPRSYNHHPGKGGRSKADLFAATKFPEDSVLSLALGIPRSRLPQLMGASLPPQLGTVSRSNSSPALAAAPNVSRDGDGGPAAYPGLSGTPHGSFACAGSDGSVLVALSVSSFSVSIDPLRWQENCYIRYPVNMNASNKASRHACGEGIVTDIMYGGVMFVEASSATAAKELQTLLASMTWTEGRTLDGVVGDVRKHLIALHGNRSKLRQATAPPRRTTAETETAFDAGTQTRHGSGVQQQQQQQAEEEKSHQYRICRRIGGRPMRDAVELQEISYFFDDFEVREECVTLSLPIQPVDATAARGAAVGPGGSTDRPAIFESRHTCNGSSLVADPDVSRPFSCVASVWVKLPVIAAVLRTWGLHLLSNPEFAQPTALFLQRYAGIAPALQPTVLGSFCNDGDTPSEEVDDDVDYLFFESGDASFTAPPAAADEATHPQPAPRIPEFNRFYASMPSTSSSTTGDPHASHPSTEARVQRRQSEDRDVPHVSCSPAKMHKSSNTALDVHDASGAVAEKQSLKKPSEETHDSLGLKSHSQDTLKDEAMHLADSVNSCWTVPGGTSGGGRQHSSVSSSIDTQDNKHVVARPSGAARESSKRTLRTLRCRSGSNKAGRKRAANLRSVSTYPVTQCNSPHSPGTGTRPQSRRNDPDGERGSQSSASSCSSPSSPTVTKEGTNDYQGNLSSLLTSCCNTPCLHGNPSPQSAYQKLLGKRLRGSTGAPSPSSPAESGKKAIVSHVPTTPLLTEAGRFAMPLSLRALNAEEELAPIAVTRAESSPMATTVSPASAATAVASGKAAGRHVSKVSLYSLHSPKEPQTCLTTANSSGNNGSAETPSAHAGKTTVTPSTELKTVARAAVKVPAKRLPPRKGGRVATRARTTATLTATTTKGVTSAEAPVIMTTKLKGAMTTSTRGKVARTGKMEPVLVKQAQTSVTHSVATVEPAYQLLLSPVTSLSTREIVVNSAKASSGLHATEDEEEELWRMVMLEVKAQQQELEDLRQACRDAEDVGKQRQDMLRLLNRILLPHTSPQELDCVLLYLRTALYEPEDIPHGRLFLPQPSWLPMLAAIWTAPANRIRTVEIAAELTWLDIPRLGLVAGLLYHQYASGPLEELIIRADKLLGSPQETAMLPKNYSSDADLVDDTAVRPKKFRLLTGRFRKSRRSTGKGNSAGVDRSSNSTLHFTTELDQVTSGFPPGCPPFFITPEEARDTLWLLLCSVAANTTAPTFRMVLRGLPAGEVSGAGRVRHHAKARTPSTRLASLFSGAAARFRHEDGDTQLLLKSRSMLLDSFVVCPGSPLLTGRDAHSHVRQSDSSGVGANVTHNSTAYDEGQLCYTNGSVRLDEDETAASSSISAQRTGNVSLQNSPVLAMSLTTATMGGIGEAACLPDQHGCDPNNTFTAVRPIVTPTQCTGEMSAGVVNGGGSDGFIRAVGAVQTHQHSVQLHRAWMRNGNCVEERPFYQLLVHRRGAAEGTTAAAQNDPNGAASKPTLWSAYPNIPCHHHPHSGTRFDGEPDGQQSLQEAVSQSATLATATSEAPSQQRQSSPSPSPPHHFPCSDFVHGLRTAADEQVALQSEAAALRERAGDIWEALRKSVKHHNELQMETHQKTMKRNGGSGSPSSPPPPPVRQIVLEY